MGSIWDIEGYVEKLKQLWLSHTASQIGEILGVSRNAVIGKAARENFPAKPGGTNQRTRLIDPEQRKQRVIDSERRKRLSAQDGKPVASKRYNFGTPKTGRDRFDGDGITAIGEDSSSFPPRALQIPLLELEPHHCRAPLGTPTMFCGQPRTLSWVDPAPGMERRLLSYCEFHARAFLMPAPRRTNNSEWSAARKLAQAAPARGRKLRIKAEREKA